MSQDLTPGRPPEDQSRVVLVTGASSGIGEATARAAAKRGDHVVLLARGQDNLDRVAADCDRIGAATSMTLSVDVSDDAAVRAAVEALMTRHGRIDIVVSCAGVVAYGRIEDVPTAVFDQVLATNLHGSANLARHVLPVLREQGTGSLVLVGSLIGHIAVPDMAAYVLSKWGVRALVRQLRVDNRDRPDLKFGYVAPGGVDTPIYLQAATYGGSVGRPPFPVATPERVAARALAVADRPWLPSQVGPSNDVIRFGFNALPWVYDRVCGPAFLVIAQDLLAPVVRGAGNVLSPDESLNALRGTQGDALVAAARNVRELVRRRRDAVNPQDG